MKFALWSSTPDVPLQACLDVSEACAIQLNRDLQAFNETGAGSTVTAFPDGTIPIADVSFEVAADIKEAPDAIAFHSVDAQGRPYCKVGWAVCLHVANGDPVAALDVLSSAISHECIEAQEDPYVRSWSDFDGTQEIANEYADPVEGDSYRISVSSGASMAVSNFVTDRYFSDGPGPYDFLSKLTAPRTMSPGGYMVLRTGGPSGTTNQVYGDAMPQWKRYAKAKYSRRA